jgi:hypothetical protein
MLMRGLLMGALALLAGGCADSHLRTSDDDPTHWRDGETPSQVGSACAIAGELCYDAREVIAEPHSASCGGLVCMAYGLHGCEDERYGPDQPFCTCRCSSLAGDPDVPLCACPDGTRCVDDVLSLEGTGFGGGYCVPCTAWWVEGCDE